MTKPFVIVAFFQSTFKSVQFYPQQKLFQGTLRNEQVLIYWQKNDFTAHEEALGNGLEDKKTASKEEDSHEIDIFEPSPKGPKRTC